MEPCEGQRKADRTQFCPSTVGVLGLKLRSTSAASAFIHGAISLAPSCSNCSLTQVAFVCKRRRLWEVASSIGEACFLTAIRMSPESHRYSL